MSSSRTIQYTCPYCGKEFETEVYDTVTADVDDDLRERCISGDLFRLSCPHCKKDYMIQYPLLYIDKSHKFVLWLSQQEAIGQMKETGVALNKKGFKLRRVTTLEQFSEKISIFEDGLDDRLVELAKYDSFIEVIDNRKANPEEITSVEYQKTNDEVMKINVRMNDKGMSFLIPVGGVQEEMAQSGNLYQIDNASFPLIDSDWIISLFEKPAGQA